jgi:phage shock protein A
MLEVSGVGFQVSAFQTSAQRLKRPLVGGDKPRPYKGETAPEMQWRGLSPPLLETDVFNKQSDLKHCNQIKELTMGILTRVVRIFKADVHGVMDQLEDRHLLLKQHLRDMAEALSLKEVKLNAMLASRKQAQQDHDKYRRQSQALEQDLAVAIHNNKDDIARMLIRKIKPLDSLGEALAGRICSLDDEISACRDELDQQRVQYERLKHRSIEFFHKTPVSGGRQELSEIVAGGIFGELSEPEIELELLKRKEALGEGS